MSGARLAGDQSTSSVGSAILSHASDLDTREESSAVEQESAKLQAEVLKLSQELEDLIASRGISEHHTSKSDHFSAMGDEREFPIIDSENSFSPSEAKKSRFGQHFPPLLESGEKDYFGRELPSPSFARAAQSERLAEASASDMRKVSRKRRSRSLNWRRVNELLLDAGFPALQIESDGVTVGDSVTLCETLRTVLFDYQETRRKLTDASKKVSILTGELELLRNESSKAASKLDEIRHNYEREVREARREVTALQGKVEVWQAQCRQKDQTIAELRALQGEEEVSTLPEVLMVYSDREKAIFRKHFAREPLSLMDTKVLTLIGNYEEMRKRIPPEPRTPSDHGKTAALQDTINNLQLEITEIETRLRQLSEENSRLKQKQSDSSPTMLQILSLLDLKTEPQVLEALRKMLQVIRAIPGLEHFIKTVSAEVLDVDMGVSGIDEIIPTIKEWKAKAALVEEMEELRRHLCKALSVREAESTGELVRITQVRRAREAASESSRFRKLFDISPSEGALQTMSHVFFFVHEMKGLLQVAREELGMDGSVPVKEQVDVIKYRLRS